MNLSEMPQDHTVYLSALRQEANRVIASVKSKCNEDLHNHYLRHIENAFTEAISSIEKSRKSFGEELDECKRDYGDEPKFYDRILGSQKRMAIIGLNGNIWVNTLKDFGKQSGIDISEMLQIIDQLKQETLDFINSAK